MKDSAQNTHYCYIKKLSRLIKSQLTKHKTKVYICKRCLSFYHTEDKLSKHKLDCDNFEAVRYKLPEPENASLKFENHHHSMRIGFSIYADFESMLKKVSTCTPSEASSYTVSYQKHEPISFTYYVVRSDGVFEEPVVYFGEDAASVFVNKMEEESARLTDLYKINIPMLPLTQDEQRSYDEATICHVCKGDLNNDKVRDHDHSNGRYRGAAHSACNLNYQAPKFIPVFCHNMSNYDTHLFIKAFSGSSKVINIIAHTEECIAFNVRYKKKIKSL